MISESESYQRQLVGCTAVPNGDELRRIVHSVRTSASDDASPTEYVLAGWKAAMLAAPQQKPVGEVQHLHELNDSWLNKLPVGTKLYTAPKPAPMSRDQIREVFMANGFTVKEGQTDLKQYVYDAAYALLGTKPEPLSDDAKDAARYRWLREGNVAKHGAAWHVAVNLYGCEWDSAIDAAIATQGENT